MTKECFNLGNGAEGRSEKASDARNNESDDDELCQVTMSQLITIQVAIITIIRS